jgi:hypothetical protein
MLSSQLFIGKRTDVSKSRMSSLSVIVDFEVLKKGLSGLLMGGVDLITDALFFERPEETLHSRVVPTIAFAWVLSTW